MDYFLARVQTSASISFSGAIVLLVEILGTKYILNKKKLRKLCLRGYDKTSKIFKDILISQYYNVSIFL